MQPTHKRHHMLMHQSQMYTSRIMNFWYHLTVNLLFILDQFQLGCLTLSKVNDSVTVMKNIFDMAVNQMAELKVHCVKQHMIINNKNSLDCYFSQYIHQTASSLILVSQYMYNVKLFPSFTSSSSSYYFKIIILLLVYCIT